MKKLVIAGILATLTTTANAMSVEEVVSSKIMTYDVLSTTCKMLKKKSRYTKEEVAQLKAFATENKICGHKPEIKVISTKVNTSAQPNLQTKINELEKQNQVQAQTIDILRKIIDTHNIDLVKAIANPYVNQFKDSPKTEDNDFFTIDSFYTKFNYAYIELNVKENLNKIVCRVKNNSGKTVASDTKYNATVGWHTQIVLLPSEGMSGLKVHCQSQ